MIAQEKELELDAAMTRKLANEWQAKASRAVTAGRDDLAREASAASRTTKKTPVSTEQQLDVQKQAVANSSSS